jgi:hypothetical protein
MELLDSVVLNRFDHEVRTRREEVTLRTGRELHGGGKTVSREAEKQKG